MGRPRELRYRVGRIFSAGTIVPLRDLREGDEFVTLATNFEGYVVERRSDGVLIDLMGRGRNDGQHVTRRCHGDVRVAVA